MSEYMQVKRVTHRYNSLDSHKCDKLSISVVTTGAGHTSVMVNALSQEQ